MIRKSVVLVLLTILSQRLTHAQSLVPPDEIADVAKQIINHPRKNTMECHFPSFHMALLLSLDLRYHAGFFCEFPIAEMPEGGKLRARIRVTPQKGPPVLLAEYFDIPSASQAASTLARPGSGRFMATIGGASVMLGDYSDAPTASQAASTVGQPVTGPFTVNISGDFLVGPGEYRIELLLISPDNRIFFKQWSVKARPASGLPGLMRPNTVDEVGPPWSAKFSPNGIRLTLLLNATVPPHSPFWLSNIRGLNARSLLKTANTIVEHLPCRSLRIVAFDLDQQVELFQRDGFTAKDWDDVQMALSGAQDLKIDYRKLARGADSDFLTHLVERETFAASDAVVLFGGRTEFSGKSPKEIKPSVLAGAAKLYYFRDDSVSGRDDLTRLVEELHGTVLPFDSPVEFGRALERLHAEIGVPAAPATR